MKYYLEFYEIDNLDTPIKTLESDSPFMSFETGDLINTSGFNDELLGPHQVFRVFAVQHYVWKSGDEAKHKKCIYMKLIDSKKSLFNPNLDD